MLVVLVVGYIIARLVARVLTALSEKLGLQIAAERSGLAESMQHMGIKRNVPAIVGTIVFWLLMCVFVMAAFSILGLAEAVGRHGHRWRTTFPSCWWPRCWWSSACWWPASCGAWWPPAPTALGICYAEHLANACYYALAVLTFIAAFDQLGIHFELLDNLILIAFGGLALGFGLSFGLGGREVMAGILAGYYLRQRLKPATTSKWPAWRAPSARSAPWPPSSKPTRAGLINRHTVPNTKMLNEAVR